MKDNKLKGGIGKLFDKCVLLDQEENIYEKCVVKTVKDIL